jgi:3-hydroxybutyryl-CoA dehydrogenase
MHERLGIAGSGAIACGLAACAARYGEVTMWARSPASARRARAEVDRLCGRLSGEVNAGRVEVVEELAALGACSTIVEAIAEDADAKRALLARLDACATPDALLCTTTSSLSVGALAEATARPDRFLGLHVFNPVPKMALVELVFPAAASADTRERALALCRDLDKEPIVVPDTPGFVVNRLLFPYLFDAVELLEESGMAPEDIDAAMRLGAGHPMGPLALLDLIGLDVAAAIGDEIGARVPERVRALAAGGATGRKAGRGFYEHPPASR